MAAGKTSTAARIAQQRGWTHIPEDEVWNRVKAGRPAGELRTPKEQETVWRQVLERLLSLIDQGQNVVLEFILYEAPPRPLIAYQDALRAVGIPFETRILRPSAEAVLRRMRERGRPGDVDLEARRRNVVQQLACLTPPHLDAAWLIDTSDLSLEEVYARHFQSLVAPATDRPLA